MKYLLLLLTCLASVSAPIQDSVTQDHGTYTVESGYMEVSGNSEFPPLTPAANLFVRRYVPSNPKSSLVGLVMNGGVYFSENYTAKALGGIFAKDLGMECVVPDRRGCGKSDGVDYEFTSYTVASDFRNMLKELYGAKKKFILVGHSSGSAIARTMAFCFSIPFYKFEVAGLILINGSPADNVSERACYHHAYKEIARRTLAGDWKLFLAFAMKEYGLWITVGQLKWALAKMDEIYYRLEELGDFEPILSGNTMDLAKRSSTIKHYRNSEHWTDDIKVPVEMIGGDEDVIPGYVFDREAELMRTRTSGEVGLTILEKCGHRPWHPSNRGKLVEWLRESVGKFSA